MIEVVGRLAGEEPPAESALLSVGAVVVVGHVLYAGGLRAAPRHQAARRRHRRADRAAVPRRREPTAARRRDATRDRSEGRAMTPSTPASAVRYDPYDVDDRRRSVPDVDPAPRRGPALPERRARLLRAEPVGRREAGAARLGHLPLRAGHGPRRSSRPAWRSRRGSCCSRTRRSTTRTGRCSRGSSRRGGCSTSSRWCAATASGARRAARAGRVRRHRRVRRRDPAAHDRASCSASPRTIQDEYRKTHRRRHHAPTAHRSRSTSRRSTPCSPSSATTSSGGRSNPCDDLMTELLQRRGRRARRHRGGR